MLPWPAGAADWPVQQNNGSVSFEGLLYTSRQAGNQLIPFKFIIAGLGTHQRQSQDSTAVPCISVLSVHRLAALQNQ